MQLLQLSAQSLHYLLTYWMSERQKSDSDAGNFQTVSKGPREYLCCHWAFKMNSFHWGERTDRRVGLVVKEMRTNLRLRCRTPRHWRKPSDCCHTFIWEKDGRDVCGKRRRRPITARWPVGCKSAIFFFIGNILIRSHWNVKVTFSIPAAWSARRRLVSVASKRRWNLLNIHWSNSGQQWRLNHRVQPLKMGPHTIFTVCVERPSQWSNLQELLAYFPDYRVHLNINCTHINLQ